MPFAPPPLRILVVDDHAVAGDAVEQFKDSDRFRRWLKSNRPIEVTCEPFALAAGGEYTQERLAGYDAIVVDLRLPANPHARSCDWSAIKLSETPGIQATIEELCSLGYHGFTTLAYLASHPQLRLLRRTLVHSANVDSVQEEFRALKAAASRHRDRDGGEDDLGVPVLPTDAKGSAETLVSPGGVPDIFAHFCKLGLIVCEKGRAASIELEFHLFSLLHIAVSCQIVEPQTRWSLLQVAHRGVRSGHLSHALIAGPMGSGAFVAEHLHALTGHYADILREETAFRTVETDLTSEEVPRLWPSLTSLRSFGPEGQVSLTDLHGQQGRDGTARYGVLVAPIVQGRLSSFDALPASVILPVRVTQSDVFCDVFIEELSDVPSRAQASFIRLLEEGELRPVNADWSHCLRDENGALHFRLLAATRLIEPKNENDLPEGVSWSAAAMAAPAPRVLRSELWYRMGLPKIKIPPLTRADVVDAVNLIVRSIPNGREFIPDWDFNHYFADVVSAGLCPGDLLQLRTLVEEASFAAEERAAHPAFRQSRSSAILKSDAPLTQEEIVILKYFWFARKVHELTSPLDRKEKRYKTAKTIADVSWQILLRAIGPAKLGRWLPNASMQAASNTKVNLDDEDISRLKEYIGSTSLQPCAQEEVKKIVTKEEAIDVFVLWVAWRGFVMQHRTTEDKEVYSLDEENQDYVEKNFSERYKTTYDSRIFVKK